MIETHPHIRKLLARALKKGRPAHAYLIVGPEGAGKRTLARELAAALLCDRRAFPPCRECGSCRRVTLGNHPDLFEVEKSGKNISIAQIIGGKDSSGKVWTGLIKDIQLHSFEGGYKVGILADVENMNEYSMNAFLKTLEEPPADTVFILTAGGLNRVLPTILSRCQVLRVGPLPDAVIRELVIKERGLDEERASLVATLARGNARRALEFDLDLFLDHRRKLIEELLRLDAGEIPALIDFAEKVSGAGFEHDVLMEFLTAFYRDALKAKLGIVGFDNRDLADTVRATAAGLTLPAILGRIQTLLTARSRLAGNANPRVTWEILTMSLKDVPGAKLEAT